MKVGVEQVIDWLIEMIDKLGWPIDILNWTIVNDRLLNK